MNALLVVTLAKTLDEVEIFACGLCWWGVVVVCVEGGEGQLGCSAGVGFGGRRSDVHAEPSMSWVWSLW